MESCLRLTPGGAGGVVLCGLLLLAGCPLPIPPPSDPPAPPAPITVSVTIRVVADAGPVTGARVRLDGFEGTQTTDAEGWARFDPPVTLVDSHLFVEADGYQPQDRHLDIHGASLGVEVTLARAHRVIRGQLQARGRALTYPDGSPFRWRGVTAFALVAQVAHGQEAEARAYLAWAAQAGFSVVRVLAMCQWLDLSPDAGLAALPRTLTLIRDADLYAEVVALADTRTWPGLDLGAQVAGIGRIVAGYDHAVLEIANEPYHATQQADRLTPAQMPVYWSLVPRDVLVTFGPSSSDESAEYAGGDYVVAHLDRGRQDWQQVRRVRELETLSAESGKPVVSDEPIGFGEVFEPGRRWTDPALAFGFGVLSRIFEVGTTFHLEAGLRCQIPGPVQLAAADAFLAGTRIVPDGTRLVFKNAGWPDSPVKGADFGRVVRVYSGLGDPSITVALGLTGDPRLEWQLGYRPGAVLAERPGLTVWQIHKE